MEPTRIGAEGIERSMISIDAESALTTKARDVVGSYAAISAAETSYPPGVERPRNCSEMNGVPAKVAAQSEAARSEA
jgi:hypothetical protein